MSYRWSYCIFYAAFSLKDLLCNIHSKGIIAFVHAVGLTNKLFQA